MNKIHDLKCIRHPDQDAEYAIVSHYLDGCLLEAVKAEQILEVLCGECRLQLIRWFFQK